MEDIASVRLCEHKVQGYFSSQVRQTGLELSLGDWLYTSLAKCLFFPWAWAEKCYFFKSSIWETLQAYNCWGKGRTTCQAKHLRENLKYCKQKSNPLSVETQTRREEQMWWCLRAVAKSVECAFRFISSDEMLLIQSPADEFTSPLTFILVDDLITEAFLRSHFPKPKLHF